MSSASGQPGFDVEEALREVRDLEGLHEGLVRRTAAVTWVLWGLVLTGLNLHYQLAAGPGPDLAFLPWAHPFLWMPWAAVGVALTWALWRSAGLELPGIASRSPLTRTLLLVLILGMAMLGWALSSWLIQALGVLAVGTAVYLLGAGIAVVLAAATELVLQDRTERVVGSGVGSALVLSAVVTVWVLEAQLLDPAVWFLLVLPVLMLALFAGAGVYLIMRG